MLTTQCRYDLANRLIGITYPSGLVASYTRDAQGRVSAVSLARGTWALPLVTQVGYQPFGPMSSIAFGHGQTLAKQWDRNYEPDAITSPALDYAYTLDDVGNLTRIQSAIEGEQRYGYDNLDRLESIREQNEALIESFAYDATGNRTSHTVGASTTSYSYPGSSHRLEQVGLQARTFDAAGNTVSGIAGSSFAFDARNRLVEVNAGGAIRQRMNYNGRGERVLSAEGNPAPAWPTTSSAWAQAAAAGVRATVYDEQGQVLSTLRGGNPLRFEEIVWIDSTPVARVESSTSAVLTVHAIHTDHLNTPRALVNAQTQGGQAAGTVVWRWRLVNQGTSGSNAFGAMAAEEDPDGNGTTLRFDLRFPGQQYDASAGLHYNYFRDYEAQTGRYVESDPIGLRGGVGTYVYVANSSLVGYDPLGLRKCILFNANSQWSSDIVLMNSANSFSDREGELLVFAHGNPNGIMDDRGGGPWVPNRKPLTAEEAAEVFVRECGWEPEMPITLYSCDAANGQNSFAEQISEIMQTDVTGFPHRITISNGRVIPSRPRTFHGSIPK